MGSFHVPNLPGIILGLGFLAFFILVGSYVRPVLRSRKRAQAIRKEVKDMQRSLNAPPPEELPPIEELSNDSVETLHFLKLYEQQARREVNNVQPGVRHG